MLGWRSVIGSSTRWTTTSPSASSGSTDMLVPPVSGGMGDRHGVQPPPSAAHFSPADPQPEGSIQHPVCLVGRELYSGRKIELFEGDFGPAPPFSLGADVLFIAYNAVAEWLTFLALGWPLPCRVFDPYIEYRRHICGTPRDINVPGNKSFLAALGHFGIAKLTADEKDEERDFVLRGGPWPDPADRRRILTIATPMSGRCSS